MVDFIGDWYVSFLGDEPMASVTSRQIEKYCSIAVDQDLVWTA